MLNKLRALALVVAVYGFVGCGGTRIKDYDEAVPVPDVPLAGGGSGDGEEPEDDLVLSSGTPAANTSGGMPGDRSQQRSKARPQPLEETSPTKSVEFD